MKEVQPFGFRHPSIAAMVGTVIAGGPRCPIMYLMLDWYPRDWSKDILLEDSTPILRLHQAVAVARGLSYLNLNCGVIHCDLKPDNVMINAERQAVICDFGTAVVFGAPGDEKVNGYKAAATAEELAPQVSVPLSKDLKGFAMTLSVVAFGLEYKEGMMLLWNSESSQINA